MEKEFRTRNLELQSYVEYINSNSEILSNIIKNHLARNGYYQMIEQFYCNCDSSVSVLEITNITTMLANLNNDSVHISPINGYCATYI
jgi:hypothetical protein